MDEERKDYPVSARLPAETLRRLDLMARAQGRSRSAMIARLIDAAAGDDLLARILGRLEAIEARLERLENPPDVIPCGMEARENERSD